MPADATVACGFMIFERGLMMKNNNNRILTLKEALREPRKHRNMDLAMEPMDNYKKTPGGPHGQPLSFWSAWNLADRPRRIALLLDDCQEEYRPYAGSVLPNIIKLVDTF